MDLLAGLVDRLEDLLEVLLARHSVAELVDRLEDRMEGHQEVPLVGHLEDLLEGLLACHSMEV